MADGKELEAYEKILVASLARVTDWLKFSETKNGALLAFASAWAVASGNMLFRKEGVPVGYAHILPIATLCFVAAVLRLIWSFMPRVDLASFLWRSHRAIREPNLIFYGDIAGYDVAAFPDVIKARYLPAAAQAHRPEYISDIAIQIRVLSAIALKKFRAFRTAGWLCLAGIVSLAIPACSIGLHQIGSLLP